MFKRKWSGFRTATPKDFEVSIDTSVTKKDLDKVAKQLTTVPKDFNIFKKSEKLLKTREQNVYKR